VNGPLIDTDELIRRHRAGETVTALAAPMGVSRDRVRRILVEAGLDPSARGNRPSDVELPPAVLRYLDELELRGCTATTLKNRRNFFQRLSTQLPCPLLEVTPDDLLDWQRQWAGAVGQTTRHSYTSTVRVFYRWAKRRGYIGEDPSESLVQIKTRKGLPRPIDEDALSAVLSTASERVRPWLVLAAYAGLRAAEIANLRREDMLVTADPPVIVVRSGKGRKDRVVPMHMRVRWELDDLPRRGWLFPRRDGNPGPVSPHGVSQLSNRHLHAQGSVDTLHQLRHRFATQLYRVSRDLRLVGECLGHADPRTTAGYAAYAREKAAEMVAAL
jgi:integrase